MLRKRSKFSSAGSTAVCVATAIAGTVGLPGSDARADVMTAFYNNDSHFSYHIINMPDLDQQRFGLDGNGAMHCVPAATMNLLGYAANHGFPDVLPGPQNWQLQQNHGYGTFMISMMGTMMGTSFVAGDPNAVPPVPNGGGTSPANADAGLATWLESDDNLIWDSHLTAPNFTVNFSSIAKSLISGNIGTMHFGRYDIVGTAPGNIPIVQRSGGHAVTVVRCYRFGETSEIWVRDPADGNDSIDSQSTFVNRVWQVDDIPVWVLDNNNPQGMQLRFMSALSYNQLQTTIRMMDSHRAIRPKTGYSFSPSSGSFGIVVPKPLGGGGPTIQAVPTPAGPIFGVNFHPMSQDFIILAGDRKPQLYQVNLLNNEHTPIALPAEPSFVKVVDNGDTYVITRNNELHRLTPEFDLVASTTLPHDAVPTEEMSLNFSKIDSVPEGPIPHRSTIAVATMLDHKMMFFPLDLAPPVIYDLPSMMHGDLIDMAIDPTTGRAWFITSGNDDLFGVMWRGNGTAQIDSFNHPAISDPTGLDFDDAGNLHICDDGHLNVFTRNAAGGWQLDEDSLFHGIECAGVFAMMRNSSNLDPAIHNHPSWTSNIDPASLIEFGELVPDCITDLNHDDVVNEVDLLLLLESWGPCDACPADLNGDGTVNVFDLLMMLTAWGECY